VATDAHLRGARFGDEAVVAALRAHDEAVFARLVDDWSPGMLRLARAHVSTRASAEEVVQEAWVAVLRGLHRFEGRSKLRTWVFGIVANIAKTTGVRESRSVPFSATVRDDDGPTVEPSRFQGPHEPHPGGWRRFPPAWPLGPEGAVLAGEAGDLIRASVQRLPPRQRAVIALRDVDGFDAAEVCELLDLTPGNQRVLLHRARAAVRAELERYFTGGDAP
jgi:RNA polymerase sigma-70 factor (ECF subfamily)